MKLTRNFIWIAFLLEIVIAQVSTDGNVLNLIVNQLNEINEKVNKIENDISLLKQQNSGILNLSHTVIQQNREIQNQDQHTEFQCLRNTIESFNKTLDSIANYWGPAFPNCTLALQTFNKSGVYRLYLENTGIKPYDAYCLLDPEEDQGWTVIQRRQDNTTPFYRNWHDYKYGFGDPSEDYWLGLEKLYAMTSKQKYELWIELSDYEGEKRYAKYAAFEIGNEEEKYYLKTLGEYAGNAGHSLGDAGKKRIFSTYDNNNKAVVNESCLLAYQINWWSDDCSTSSLNGEFNNDHNDDGINWHSWHGISYSLKYAHMAIRPVK